MHSKAARKQHMVNPKTPYVRNGHCAAAPAAQEAVVPCKYKAGRVLGRGTYAEVKEMVHISTGQRFAGKVINRSRVSSSNSHLVQNEIAILKKLSHKHPNLLALVDYFNTPRNTYLITELCEGGELFDYIHRRLSLGEAEAAHVVRQIVEGVAFLHANGIMHRDLKTENCLVRTDEAGAPVSVAIADFGMAHQVPKDGGRLHTSVCGTPGYMAPEMVQRLGHGKPVDMWAVGVITYFALSGRNPFQRHNRAAEIQAIVAGAYEFAPAHRWAGVSAAARDFISSLLVVDPAKRMTAQQALKHPWLRNRASCSKQAARETAAPNHLDFDTHCQISSDEDSSDVESGTRATQPDSQKAPFGAGVLACAAGTQSTAATSASTAQPAAAHPSAPEHNQNDGRSDERPKSLPASNSSSQATCVGTETDGHGGLTKMIQAHDSSAGVTPFGALPAPACSASDPLYCCQTQSLVCPLTGHLRQMATHCLRTPVAVPDLAGATRHPPPVGR